ncbi:MAG TPA: N-acyl homoserine lactonase family protein [Burkholderiales bacterium]|jgi:glyoxylase-like metal-dependent hydrolase (beta-lactamase superfamily II)|nr:N-acyl homoserine lactonase family protein [Burkholderiales bacterium]
MTLPIYEVYAVRYATREARRGSHFLGGDPHDAPMPMDYFVWVIRNSTRTYVVDLGFTGEVAARRKRTLLRPPAQGLALLGVDAKAVTDVIVTHMHYDHIGTFQDFPQARFHLQDDEMAFVTGRHMCHGLFRHHVEVEDVVGFVRMLYDGRVQFHKGDDELAPGITLHRIGGHTAGLQSVRVHTRRGWVVLASDASHYYEHFEKGRCFPIVFDVADTLEGYATLQRLAESPEHIIPGHDPLVVQRYAAASNDLEGIVVRLDVMPRR